MSKTQTKSKKKKPTSPMIGAEPVNIPPPTGNPLAELLEYVVARRGPRPGAEPEMEDYADKGEEWGPIFFDIAQKDHRTQVRRVRYWDQIHKALSDRMIHSPKGPPTERRRRTGCCGQFHATPFCPLCGKKLFQDPLRVLLRRVEERMRSALRNFGNQEERTEALIEEWTRNGRGASFEQQETIEDRQRHAKRIHRKYLQWERRQDALLALIEPNSRGEWKAARPERTVTDDR